MAVTIKDVAKETNLAISTISKYMNGGNVRKKNRELIENAIKKLGYTPNNTARGLRNSKTYIIGLIVERIHSPHEAKIISEIEKKLRMMGYSMMLANHEDDILNAKRYVQYMIEKGVDGIVAMPMTEGIEYLNEVSERKIPLVVLEENSTKIGNDCIQVNCTSGAYQIVEHLIETGHKKIAIIKGPESRRTARERYQGYLRVMNDYGYSVEKEYEIDGDYGYQGGYQGIVKLWEPQNKPTAVFITNYDMCVGAMSAVHDLHIQVPQELSIVAFDDFELSVMVQPKLTTVRQPLTEMADIACELLRRRINGDYSDYPRKIRLHPECVFRNSVKVNQLSIKELLGEEEL